MTRYFLDQDNSSHWYLVEESRREEWSRWANLPEDDERSTNGNPLISECQIAGLLAVERMVRRETLDHVLGELGALRGAFGTLSESRAALDDAIARVEKLRGAP